MKRRSRGLTYNLFDIPGQFLHSSERVEFIFLGVTHDGQHLETAQVPHFIGLVVMTFFPFPSLRVPFLLRPRRHCTKDTQI